jgi:hypothetical protein
MKIFNLIFFYVYISQNIQSSIKKNDVNRERVLQVKSR